MIERLGEIVRHAVRVSSAFIRMGARNAVNYPLGYAMRQITALLPVVIYFFVAQLVAPATNVGGDYYTFVVIGLVGVQLLDVGMRSFSTQLEAALERGWFEMVLVSPLRWTLLPFGMVQFGMIQTLVRIVIIIVIAVALGAQFDPEGIPTGIVIAVLALTTGLAFGILLAGMKVLAKSGDPLLPLYSLGAQVFSGVFFPVESLPEWLRPLSFLFPHTYVIAALRRELMPEGADLPGMSAGSAIVVLLLLSAVLFPLAVFLFKRAMELGRRLGVLAGY